MEYTKKSRGHYDRKAGDIAAARVSKESPELALKLSKHQSLDWEKEIRESQLRLERQRALEKGMDRGLSL